jgi:hypothetical protein
MGEIITKACPERVEGMRDERGKMKEGIVGFGAKILSPAILLS